MHDDRDLVEARLRRVLDERIRPAVYPESVPLEVAVWHAPGEPVPVAEGLAATPEPTAAGQAWGAPWGTSWFTVTGTVPREGAGRTVEGLPVRGPGLPPRRHPGEGPQPPQPVGTRGRPGHRRRAGRAARRGRRQPDH